MLLWRLRVAVHTAHTLLGSSAACLLLCGKLKLESPTREAELNLTVGSAGGLVVRVGSGGIKDREVSLGLLCFSNCSSRRRSR